MSLPFPPSLLKLLNLPPPPPQQQTKLPPPEGFPERYSNDPDKKWKSGSWEEYTNAADQLDVVKSDQGFYSLQNRENSASTPCIQDLVSSEFRVHKGCDMEEFVFPYSKITMTDRKNFHLLLDQAEKDLQLFEDYFTPDGKHAMLQHDSTVENVIGRLPLAYINITEEPMFRRLLKRLISMANLQHDKELYRDYTLFLPKCERIKADHIFGPFSFEPWISSAASSEGDNEVSRIFWSIF